MFRGNSASTGKHRMKSRTGATEKAGGLLLVTARSVMKDVPWNIFGTNPMAAVQ